MNKKTGFFEESPGVSSQMRLMSFISLLAGIGLAFFAIASNQIDLNTVSLVFIFIAGAFAPKALQKFAEQKIGS